MGCNSSFISSSEFPATFRWGPKKIYKILAYDHKPRTVAIASLKYTLAKNFWKNLYVLNAMNATISLAIW